MSSFTHHNCCINLVDVVVESDAANYSDTSLLDIHNILKGTKVQELDDNVHVKETTAAHITKPHPTIKVNINHPRNLKFVPLRLDYRDHMSDALRAN
jgi:hypothetical protein